MNELNTRCYAQLRDAIPDACALIESSQGDLALRDYAASLRPSPVTPLQDGEDLIALTEAEAARIWSPAVGAALRRELEDRFMALTANHHGVDFHPEFLQGDMLIAQGCKHAVPLFACGGVPCNNMSFPRGILLPPKSMDTTLPGRYAALPVGDRHAFVSTQIPFTEALIRKSVGAAERALKAGELTPVEHAFIDRMLKEIYLHPDVLKQSRFRDQMSAANALMWLSLAAPDLELPPLVSLELQQLCGQLIAADLLKADTLMHDIVLEPQLCEAIFRCLNGYRSCWTAEGDQITRGSFLFWAMDEKGRGHALLPDFAAHELYAPRRPDLRFRLEAEEISAALKAEKLLPSLYLTFTAASLIRGLSCAGGVFQYAYLPAMQQGTAEALRLCSDSRADKLAANCPLGAGFHVFMAPDANGMAHAAGPLDIMNHGGISAEEWQAFGSVTLREAFLCAAPFEYEDILPAALKPEGWLDAMRTPAPVLLAARQGFSHA